MDKPPSIVSEIERIENDAMVRSRYCYAKGTVLTRIHYALGLPSIILSAVAGATALTNRAPLFAGLCAFAATVLTALQTWLHPDQTRTWYRSQAIAFEDLESEARILRGLDLAAMDASEQRAALEQLRACHRQLLNRSLGPGGANDATTRERSAA
jgi:hypothetical protein